MRDNLFRFSEKQLFYFIFLRVFLKSVPALNVGTSIAGILIFSTGFLGFTPVLAFLCDFLKVPNPWILTSPSFFTPEITADTNSLMKSPASLFDTPSLSAKWAISCVLVIFYKNNNIKALYHSRGLRGNCKPIQALSRQMHNYERKRKMAYLNHFKRYLNKYIMIFIDKRINMFIIFLLLSSKL